MGPFPLTVAGNQFVLTDLDYFTKWPEAYELPIQEAEMVSDAQVEAMFTRFGMPEVIHK